MIELHKQCHFQSREGQKYGPASNSEIRRWINNDAVVFNEEKVKHDELLDFSIISLVLFPKGKRISLY